MQRKILLLLSILFIVAANSFSQEVELGFQTGYGYYDMSTLRGISNESLAKLPYEGKLVSDFPPFLYYQPRVIFPKKAMKYGFVYNYQSTGARISSIDYSGEYRFDTKVYSHGPGAIINFYKFQNKLIVGIFAELGVNFTSVNLNEHLRVDTLVNNQNYSFHSTSLYAKPGINIIYPWDNYSVEFNVALFKEFNKGDLTNGQGYIPVKESLLYSDMWDGFRIGLVFSYDLSKNTLNNQSITE